MRQRRASASYGTVNRRMRLSHETILLAVMALVGLWMLGSLVQAIALNQTLNHQAAELRQQNASLRSTNDSYRRDIAAVSSGAAAEEEARQNGYARSNEKVYIISSPRPTPAPRRQAPGGAAGVLNAIWHLVTGIPDD